MTQSRPHKCSHNQRESTNLLDATPAGLEDGGCNTLPRRPREMNVLTQNRSMWALAFTAAAGLGLIFAGRALARPRIAPQSVPSVLSFNPFNPVRTTVPARVPAGFVGPLASPAPTPTP